MDTPQRIIRVAVLSSSRADFGIYLPLLKKLRQANDFKLSIIAFGTHLSKFHGYTRDAMAQAGFEPDYEISTLITNDRPEDIATSYALTALKFADFWAQHQQEFDHVLCLGDRFEMAAAVAAGIPFGLSFAHIHGGETTLGAIDNIYRHSITLASRLHFVSAAPFCERIYALCGGDTRVVLTGSLSLDNLDELDLLSKDAFLERWNINLNKPSLLITVHPETVAFEQNTHYAAECRKAFAQLAAEFQLVVTLPNADTQGTVFRQMFDVLKQAFPEQVFLIENFGTLSYFSCMKHCALLIGNTSSGIVEAASFQKFVLNLGDRQKGRLSGENVIHIPFDAEQIVLSAREYASSRFDGANLYKLGNASEVIINTLRTV
jgi:GDP/UDP-N,N'-diacetylbacillosamine 2-epimerase (hydrolysing)